MLVQQGGELAVNVLFCLLQASYPTWEDFVTKGAKLQSQLR